MSHVLSTCLLLFFAAFSNTCVGQATLNVAAAADLSSLQPQLAATFHAAKPGISVGFITGASAALAQQIENGAPYDVFLSANAGFVERLRGAGKVEEQTITTYAVGRLAILWRDGKSYPFSHLEAPSVRYIAIANPKLAPYGLAAQQALEHEKLWSRVRSKIVYGENVRQALQLFDSGNADAVLTSASLLTGRHPDLVTPSWHDPIVQKAALVSSSTRKAAGQEFLDFLKGPGGQAIFVQYGFGTPPAR